MGKGVNKYPPVEWSSIWGPLQPSGFHNGRTIYYVFGRYPKKPDGDAYPVIDLVLCHGDFLNVNHDYTHENKSIKGFGSYGDVLIRDRKMYVVPTPFHLVEGVAHRQTLILPAEANPGAAFFEVGALCRREAAERIVGYSFNLETNDLVPRTAPNPNAACLSGRPAEGTIEITSVVSSTPSTSGRGTAPASASQRSPFASARSAPALSPVLAKPRWPSAKATSRWR